MSAIAGVSCKGHRDAVLGMLQALRHRANGKWELVEEEAGTLGKIHRVISERNGQIPSSRAYVFQGRLHLQRDPLGITPLYYGFTADGNLCFASEVKALLQVTHAAYELPPGTIYDGKADKLYYHLESQTPSLDSADTLADGLRSRLKMSIERCVTQDTMGAWLSGGLDSSTVVALARPCVKTLHTFVAGLAGAPDLAAARSVADFVKAEHHEVVVSVQDLLRVLPEVIYYLESFDALLVRSSLTNFLAGQAARDYVSEVFSGEGGDELFAGYAYLKSLPISRLANELMDITNRLHNTALQRVDRCASAHGLTPWVCFLDPSVVEFASRIPVKYKVRDGMEKWIVRKAIDGLLPEAITRRSKAKFWEGAGVGEKIADIAGQQVTDADFKRERTLPNGWVLATKEELMYYRIFRHHFGSLANLDWMGRTKNAPHSPDSVV